MAKLSFYGATKGVTGSAYLLETNKASILLECGDPTSRSKHSFLNPLNFYPCQTRKSLKIKAVAGVGILALCYKQKWF